MLAVAPREGGIALPLQAFDQAAVAAPLVKEVLSADAEGAAASVRRALALAVSGEPGPFSCTSPSGPSRRETPASPRRRRPETTVDAAVVAGLAERLAAAERVVLHVGGGAADCAADVVALVERVGAVAISTTSGRGVVPEDHPRSLAVDAPGAGASALNELLDAADLVLALGVKYSHNGALGGALRIDPRRFVRVDASAAVLAAAYPADTAVEADIPTFRAGAPRRALGRARARLAARTSSRGCGRVSTGPRGRASSPASAWRTPNRRATSSPHSASRYRATACSSPTPGCTSSSPGRTSGCSHRARS